MVPDRKDIQLSCLKRSVSSCELRLRFGYLRVEFPFFKNRTSHPLSFLTVASRCVRPIACLPM